MSASLVGSEMCIRDSKYPSAIGNPLNAVSAAIHLRPQSACRNCKHGPRSCLLYTSDRCRRYA
eukprot:15100506-Alexandrium_andersonii.AAC.1